MGDGKGTEGRGAGPDSAGLDGTAITRDDGVCYAAVYIGGVTELMNITGKLEWRAGGCPEQGYVSEWLTLGEIRQQICRIFPHIGIITVFQDEPLSGTIYQYGNHKGCGWEVHGRTEGYA